MSFLRQTLCVFFVSVSIHASNGLLRTPEVELQRQDNQPFGAEIVLPCNLPQENLLGVDSLLNQKALYEAAWKQLHQVSACGKDEGVDALLEQILGSNCSSGCKQYVSDLSQQLMLCERCSLLATFANRRAGGSKIITGIIVDKHTLPTLPPMFSLGQSVADDLGTL